MQLNQLNYKQIIITTYKQEMSRERVTMAGASGVRRGRHQAPATTGPAEPRRPGAAVLNSRGE